MLARPSLLGDGIVDNDEMEVLCNIVFVKVPAGQERDSHTLEVAWKYRTVIRHDRVLLISWSALRPEEAVPVRESIVEWKVRDDTDGFDARQARKIVTDYAKKEIKQVFKASEIVG